MKYSLIALTPSRLTMNQQQPCQCYEIAQKRLFSAVMTLDGAIFLFQKTHSHQSRKKLSQIRQIDLIVKE